MLRYQADVIRRVTAKVTARWQDWSGTEPPSVDNVRGEVRLSASFSVNRPIRHCIGATNARCQFLTTAAAREAGSNARIGRQQARSAQRPRRKRTRKHSGRLHCKVVTAERKFLTPKPHRRRTKQLRNQARYGATSGL